jgi:hypothetical protein
MAMRSILYGIIIALVSTGITLLINGWRMRRTGAHAAAIMNDMYTSGAGIATDTRTHTAPNRTYTAHATLMNPAEQQFIELLYEILPADYTYTARVALNRLVTVRQLRRTRVWRDARWSRIAQKSIDVVVMRASDTKPVLAILFEDNMNVQTAVGRDEFLAAVMREVNLPVVYIATSTMHIREAVQYQIVPFLRV